MSKSPSSRWNSCSLPRTHNRTTALALTGLVMALIATPMLAQGAPELFRPVGERSTAMMDRSAAQAHTLAIDASLLQRGPGSLTFVLGDGQRVQAQGGVVDQRGRGDLLWRGRLQDGGDAILTLKNGYVMGLVETPRGSWELTSDSDGAQILVRLDPEGFGSCGNEYHDPSAEQYKIENDSSTEAPQAAAATRDSADSVDVMVLYTPQAQSGAGGQAAIEATIQSAVDVSNQAFADSAMDIRFNLVHTELANRNDSGSAAADRNWARDDPTVQALRDVYRADMVGLIVENAGAGLCGIAFLMGNQSAAAYAPNGYQVTDRGCAVGNRTYAHEHGHNMGLQHNPEAGAPSSQAFTTFAYGHYINGNYRTVMAAFSSPCPSGCTRVGRFSNPNLIFQGAATGIANQRDNARTSNLTAPFVANWRERLPAAAACSDCVSFSSTGTVSYSNQDNGSGPVAVVDSRTLGMGGNRWRRTNQTYTINADTVLEFEFMSTNEGEIHAIGFDEDDTLTNDVRVFQVFGTQIWSGAQQAATQYGAGDVGSFRSFQIPVGQFYTGSNFRLVLVNDDDGSTPNNTSFFRNVRLTGGVVNPPADCTVDDDFESGAAGWTIDGSSTCSTGTWILGTPTVQSNGGVTTQVGGDHTTGSGSAIYTASNTNAGVNDVDGGVCVLASPTWNVSDDSELAVWYFHGQRDTGGDPNGDFFRLEISINGGAFTPIVSIGDVQTNAAWTLATANVSAGDSVRLRVQASDGSAVGDLVEAGIDDLSICATN